MWISITATREKGRTYQGTMSVVRTEVETTDPPPAAIPLYITASVKGHRDPTSRAVATQYEGELRFEPEEVINLFWAMVKASGKSAEFKRVVRTVISEFSLEHAEQIEP